MIFWLIDFVLTSTPSRTWSRSFTFSDQNFLCVSYRCRASNIRRFGLLGLIIRMIGEVYELQHEENRRQSHNVAKFKIWERQYQIKFACMKKTKSRLHSRKACCHMIQHLWSSWLLSTNIQNYNFASFLYGFETWSRVLREDVWEWGPEEDIWA